MVDESKKKKKKKKKNHVGSALSSELPTSLSQPLPKKWEPLRRLRVFLLLGS
jgi:hypothetical protein